jgi:hypothetical protein
MSKTKPNHPYQTSFIGDENFILECITTHNEYCDRVTALLPKCYECNRIWHCYKCKELSRSCYHPIELSDDDGNDEDGPESLYCRNCDRTWHCTKCFYNSACPHPIRNCDNPITPVDWNSDEYSDFEELGG